MHKVTFYLPSRGRSGEPIGHAELHHLHRLTILDVVEVTGGATETVNGAGYWKDPSGRLVEERVNLLWTFCTPEQLPPLFALARLLVGRFDQESVLIELDGQPRFFNR